MSEGRQELLLPFLLSGFGRLLLRSLLAGIGGANVGGGQDDAVVHLAGLLVDPLGRLEEALDGYERSLDELLQRLGVLVPALRFHSDQRGYADGLFAAVVLTGD